MAIPGTQPIQTPDEVRGALPEFQDTTKWPDAAIQIWIDLAGTQFAPRAWGQKLRLGMLFYIAHNLVLSARDAAAAAAGGVGGAIKGLVASKSSAGGSISYDLGAVTQEGAGTYNLTLYGARYWQLLQSLPAMAYL